MSRIRGVAPLFVATAFGIGNALWAFGPAFEQQKEEKDERNRKALETAHKSDEITIRNAEEASRSTSTKSALKVDQPVNSWWSNLSLWTREKNGGHENSTPSHIETKEKPKQMKTDNH